MLKKLVLTQSDCAATVARLALGIVMLPHGAQKVLGMFGGHGFTATMGFFTGTMGVPWIFALLAVLAESAGSLGLITGLFSRVAAFGIAVNMLVAIIMVHSHVGFFMNWMGNQSGEGFEYHILALALAVVVMIRGGGCFSLDKAIADHCKKC